MPPKIIIAGAPASGKGTQCEFIREKYGVVHLSTGDMLRAAVAAESEVGVKAKEFMDEGKLVTDDIIIGIIKDRLKEEDCQTKGWLLDGFPRTRAQADAMAADNITADSFVFLDVPDELLVERVVGRRTDPDTGTIYHMTFNPPPEGEIADRVTTRSDDTEEKVKVRLEAFHENLAAIMECYSPILAHLNGNGEKALIFDLLQKFVNGGAAYGEGDFESAYAAFDKASEEAARLASNKAMVCALVGQARCQVALGHLKKALVLCNDVLELDAGNKPASDILKDIHHRAEEKILKKGSKGMKIIIAGAPASGKGTQCEVIKERYGVVHLSTGDMLRAAAEAGTEVGLKAKEFMDEGKLVTDEIIIGIIKERLAQPDCASKGWLLDGFPRTRAQADAMAADGIVADAFVFLDVPDSTIVERVEGRRTDPETGIIYHTTFNPPPEGDIAGRVTQRDDDTKEKVEVRLKAFHENVDAIIDCYAGIKFSVLGDQDKKIVCKQITDHLDSVQKFQVVFVLGGPGSGKGTQCTRIKEQFGYVHLSAGDLLRAEKESGSETAEMINSFIKEGKIVPAKVTVELLKKAMQASHSKKFLIDGFPRSKDNLDTWYEVMGDSVQLQMVLVFDCPEQVLEERLLDRGKTSGRSDDNISSIKKRFKTFHEQSEPVIAEFRRMGKVRIVDSVPPPAVVFKKVQRLFTGAGLVQCTDRTLAMLKPDVMGAGLSEEILAKIEAAGFVVVAKNEHQMTEAQAKEFYSEHEGKGFFKDLVEFMTSGKVTALLLERENAIKEWRGLVEGSLRPEYGTTPTKNACHGSDSFISAAREAAFWFGGPLTTQKTLAMIKPIVSELNGMEVRSCLEYRGFKIVAETTMKLSANDVEIFYNEHKGKTFFPALAGYMQSGDVVALCLEKEGAIKGWRGLLGPTDPAKAKLSDPKSLRAIFGIDGTRNGSHGSDSVSSARKEMGFWFNNGRVDVGRELGEGAGGKRPQQLSALKYLKEFVDPIMSPLLQRILSARPEDVGGYVVEDLGKK